MYKMKFFAWSVLVSFFFGFFFKCKSYNKIHANSYLTLNKLKCVAFYQSFHFTSYSFYVAKVYLSGHLPASTSEQFNKAIEFYQQTSQRNSVYCKQLELHDSSWDMFIKRLVIGDDRSKN